MNERAQTHCTDRFAARSFVICRLGSPSAHISHVHLELDPLLAWQRGLVTTEQAAEAGVAPHRLLRLCRDGLLLRQHHGVYRDPAAPVSVEQRRMAAVLAAGDGAALAPHRHRPPGRTQLPVQPAGTVTPGPSPIRRPGMLVHRSHDLGSDVVDHDGIPTTTPVRTTLDAVTVMPPVVVMRFVEQWATERRLDIDELIWRVDRRPGRRGTAQLRRLLRERDLGTIVADSTKESLLGEMLVRAGLPRPTHHHLVVLSDGHTYELDWSYPARRVALEIDGYGIHLRSYEAFDDDRWRRNHLVLNGWIVLNFTSNALRRRPRQVVDQVRAALDATRGGVAIQPVQG